MDALRTIPLVSTNHLRESTHNLLACLPTLQTDLIFVNWHGWGWIFEVPPEGACLEGVPDDVLALIAWAKERGYGYLWLNEMGELVDSLPDYYR